MKKTAKELAEAAFREMFLPSGWFGPTNMSVRPIDALERHFQKVIDDKSPDSLPAKSKAELAAEKAVLEYSNNALECRNPGERDGKIIMLGRGSMDVFAVQEWLAAWLEHFAAQAVREEREAIKDIVNNMSMRDCDWREQIVEMISARDK